MSQELQKNRVYNNCDLLVGKLRGLGTDSPQQAVYQPADAFSGGRVDVACQNFRYFGLVVSGSKIELIFGVNRTGESVMYAKKLEPLVPTF